MRIVAALWELYDGKRYVGHVEAPYVGPRPWTATASDVCGEIGFFKAKRAAIAALKRHDKKAKRLAGGGK